MDDLNQMISQIMSDPDAMTQLRSVAASLGLGNNSAPQAPQPPPQNSQPAAQGSGGVDLSALSSLLGGLGQPAPQPQPASQPDLSALSAILSGLTAQNPAPPPPATGVPDLSAIASLLGLRQNQPAPPQNPMPDLSSMAGLFGNLTGNNQQTRSNDLSALTSLLSNGSPPAQAPSGILPNFDINTILKLSNALASVQANRQNIELLLALKPRLSADRSRKVDDAIRVMQLVQFLPLIKESGLFGEMDNILGGLGNIVGGGGLGGLGNLLGGLGGLGNLLGGTGRR